MTSLLLVICSRGPIEKDSHIVSFKLLKPVFRNLKSEVPLNVKINTSGSMRKKDLSNDTTFDICQFSLDSTFNLQVYALAFTPLKYTLSQIYFTIKGHGLVY